jgi:hypothetical protein
MKTEFEETIIKEIHGNDKLLVSFGGIKQGYGMPIFEFKKTISAIQCDKIYIRDFEQAWYHKGISKEINSIDELEKLLNNILSKNNYKKICFIGNSMGAYAAILLGTILDVDNILAFAPQSFIDKSNRLINFDFRWKKQISSIYKYKKRKKIFFDLKKHLLNSTYKTNINIYYSPFYKLDKIHSERLQNNKNIFLHTISEGGHNIVKTIRDNGELSSIITECLH